LLGITLSDNSSTLNSFAYAVLGLALVILWSLSTVLGYLLGNFFLTKSNFETKYPKLSMFFKSYRLMSSTYLIIQAIICFMALFSLIIISFGYIFYIV
jgi:hypothetical protein